MTRDEYETRIFELTGLAQAAMNAGDTDAADLLVAEIVTTIIRDGRTATHGPLWPGTSTSAVDRRLFETAVQILKDRGLLQKGWLS